MVTFDPFSHAPFFDHFSNASTHFFLNIVKTLVSRPGSAACDYRCVFFQDGRFPFCSSHFLRNVMKCLSSDFQYYLPVHSGRRTTLNENGHETLGLCFKVQTSRRLFLRRAKKCERFKRTALIFKNCNFSMFSMVRALRLFFAMTDFETRKCALKTTTLIGLSLRPDVSDV